MFSLRVSSLLLTANVDIHCRGSQKKLPSKQTKKTNFFINAKFQTKPHASTSLHYVFLSFSYCQLSFCSSTFPKISLNTLVTPWRLRMKQDNWLIWKGRLSTLLTYCSTATTLISAPMILKPRQMSFGMESFWKPIISSPFPLFMVQIPNHDPLSCLYVVLELWNLFQSIAGTRFSRKSVPRW